MAIVPGEVSVVDDFAARLLSMLDYDARPGRHIRQHKDIPFFFHLRDCLAYQDGLYV